MANQELDRTKYRVLVASLRVQRMRLNSIEESRSALHDELVVSEVLVLPIQHYGTNLQVNQNNTANLQALAKELDTNLERSSEVVNLQNKLIIKLRVRRLLHAFGLECTQLVFVFLKKKVRRVTKEKKGIQYAVDLSTGVRIAGMSAVRGHQVLGGDDLNQVCYVKGRKYQERVPTAGGYGEREGQGER